MSIAETTYSAPTSRRTVLEQILAAFAREDLEGVKKGFRADSVARQALSGLAR